MEVMEGMGVTTFIDSGMRELLSFGSLAFFFSFLSPSSRSISLFFDSTPPLSFAFSFLQLNTPMYNPCFLPFPLRRRPYQMHAVLDRGGVH